MRKRFRSGRSSVEMKTLECPRCHAYIRLDEYRKHLVDCKGSKLNSPQESP